jgi:hypothetical protein
MKEIRRRRPAASVSRNRRGTSLFDVERPIPERAHAAPATEPRGIGRKGDSMVRLALDEERLDRLGRTGRRFGRSLREGLA